MSKNYLLMPGGFQSMLRLRAYLSLIWLSKCTSTHQDQSNAPNIILPLITFSRWERRKEGSKCEWFLFLPLFCLQSRICEPHSVTLSKGLFLLPSKHTGVTWYWTHHNRERSETSSKDSLAYCNVALVFSNLILTSTWSERCKRSGKLSRIYPPNLIQVLCPVCL